MVAKRNKVANKKGRGRRGSSSYRIVAASVEIIPVSSEEFFQNIMKKQKLDDGVVVNDDTLFEQAVNLHLQAVQLEKEIDGFDGCREVFILYRNHILFHYYLL